MVEFRLPKINGATDKEQLAQIKSYLYQLTEQLQWMINNLETSIAESSRQISLDITPSGSENSTLS